jgi:hypothetical protein
MIDIAKLTEADRGRWVRCQGIHAGRYGRIKDWNKRFILVVYQCWKDWDHFHEYTADSTAPEALTFLQLTDRIYSSLCRRFAAGSQSDFRAGAATGGAVGRIQRLFHLIGNCLML